MSPARMEATRPLQSHDPLSRTPSPTPLSSPDTTITEPEHPPDTPDIDNHVWDLADNGNLGDPPNDSTSPSEPHFDDGDFGSHPTFLRDEILSDLPAVRRQHMNDGYREGLSVGKARVMQSGFDAGYPVGVEVGLRVGAVLGVLEGIVAALSSAKGKGRAVTRAGRTGATSPGGSVQVGLGPEVGVQVIAGDTASHGQETGSSRDGEEDLKYVRTLYARAQSELKISELLKELDDGKFAAIPDATGTDNKDANHNGKEGTRTETLLPDEIEIVVGKWERLVLGALGKRRVEKEISTGITIEKSDVVDDRRDL